MSSVGFEPAISASVQDTLRMIKSTRRILTKCVCVTGRKEKCLQKCGQELRKEENTLLVKLSLCLRTTPWRRIQGSPCLSSRILDGGEGQLHSPAALPTEENSAVTTVY
jgi:hypothetical protein